MAKRKPSMDSITTPDLKNLNKEQSKAINTFDRYTRVEDNSGKIRADFSRAQVVHDFEIKSKKEEEEDPDDAQALVEEFSARRVPNAPTKALDKGVKVRGTYVSRRKIITPIVIVLVLLILIALFAPPIYTANDSLSGCRSEDIFAEAGVTLYKEKILSSYHVYNIDAVSSEQSDSYRICTVAFDAKNYMPFPVTVDDYIISGGGDYSDNIVYATASSSSKEIPAFSTETIEVEILINADGLTDEQFDQAITSIRLSTKGAKKKITDSISIPCLPAFMNVSNVITFDPDI